MWESSSVVFALPLKSSAVFFGVFFFDFVSMTAPSDEDDGLRFRDSKAST